MTDCDRCQAWLILAASENVKFIGIQQTRSGPMPLFTDNVTNSTFTLEKGETLAMAKRRKLKQFGIGGHRVSGNHSITR